MAFRLSGILMGGVVIVYERKVKLLYDDVTRLLVEINEAWKVKAVPDPTLLPKSKSQAKNEAVTLPDNQEAELGEIEQSLTHTNTKMEVHLTGYFAMTDTDLYNRFERFDIEGVDETQSNFISHSQIPSTLIPSPPHPAEPKKADEILDQHPDDLVYEQSDEEKEASQPQQDHHRQGLTRRKARKPAACAMDYEQIIIPGHIYKSWLQSTADIVSTREKKRKSATDVVSRTGRKRKRFNIMSTMKISKLMELPPVVLICGLFATGKREIHYPASLLELWMRSNQPRHDLPSGRISPPQPPEPSLSSPPNRAHYNDPVGFPFEDFHGGISSQSLGVPTEKQWTNLNPNVRSTEVLSEELRNNLVNNGVMVTQANVMVTPTNSGDEVKSIPSSGEVNSGRFNKKRLSSSSRHSGSGLQPVAEENSWQHPDPNFKLSRLSKNDLKPENDLLVETGPTQTQHPISCQPIDQITDCIRMQLKTHFDTPGSPQRESLNQLAFGMNKSRATHLFYHTCVLASRDFERVEQQ